jgi:DNA-binding Lrp family transcriptional regulator
VDVDVRAFGMRAHAMLWALVEPAHLEAVGRAMAEHAEVPFVTATTGPTNLMATVVCRDMASLYSYVTNQLAPLPGVTAAEAAPLIRVVKRAGPVQPGKPAQRPTAKAVVA